MSLKSIVQDVAKESGTIAAPTAVVSNSDPAVQKLLRLSNKVGQRLMKVYPWQVLRKERTFTSVASETQTSILPSDFDRIVTETFWNRTDTILISGPVSPVEWQGIKARTYTNKRQPRFAYRNDSILVTPTLEAGKSLAFEYVSKNWCQDSSSAGQLVWGADDDTGILDEELMTLGLNFAYLNSEGLPANLQAAEFEEYLNLLTGNEESDTPILSAGDIFGDGRHFDGVPGSGSNVIDWG